MTMSNFFYLVATDQKKGLLIGVVKAVLWVLSFVFGGILLLRKALYQARIAPAYRLTKPVISIGNLTVGGTGKTPLVAYIAGLLVKKGLQPVILTRGYMGRVSGVKGNESDEAAVLRGELPDVPVLVGADRVKNAKHFIKDHAVDVFLMDDGFQHWRLKRDLDIVTVDAANPWGNGCLLPRGILREPKSALARADLFVLTRSDQGKERLTAIKNDLHKQNARAPIVEAVHRPVCLCEIHSGTAYDLHMIREKKVYAVSSIGAPDAFIRTLTGLGAQVQERRDFSDHHRYTPKDIQEIVKSCVAAGISFIVTTEKDAVKLRHWAGEIPQGLRVISLVIKIDIIHGEDRLVERINTIL